MERMATCGWLMMGALIKVPNGPGLVIVKVPPWRALIGRELHPAQQSCT
ncbi:hypothetical protein [Streptosporangium sp. NPDC002607]